AMRGIDSHAVRQIAAECAELSPDLFIIYMGNNEMIGLHAPSPEEFQLSANVHWLRLQHTLKRTKLAQLGESLLARAFKKRPVPDQDMDFFRRQRIAFDDPIRNTVYKNCTANLRDICQFASSAGAKSIVCSVGTNLRDFPPLGSLHRRDLTPEQQKQWEQAFAAGKEAEARREPLLALTNYESAARLDDHFGELLFRMARCYEAAGKPADARRHYALARDWDAIQFRTDIRLNDAIRAVAASDGSKMRFIDIEKNFTASRLAENGIPGARIFHEHVHLTFDGDHQIASWLLPEVAGTLKLPPPTPPRLARDECARRLAYTSLDEGNMKVAIARLTANPPFLDQVDHALRQAAANAEIQEKMGSVSGERIDVAIATYATAIRARPGDWMLHFNLANLLSQVGQHREAAAEFAEVIKRLPGHRSLRAAYGNALLQAGQFQEAERQFAAALKVDPNYPPAQQGMKSARSVR
ncbi:MAG TPA: tetratricopeptide repeat protein, partial [Candidatus Limnocylindria bacterium]|nr:tetratricopeptide repeat protein [Candidatus Limnocylindria bacterium]